MQFWVVVFLSCVLGIYSTSMLLSVVCCYLHFVSNLIYIFCIFQFCILGLLQLSYILFCIHPLQVALRHLILAASTYKFQMFNVNNLKKTGLFNVGSFWWNTFYVRSQNCEKRLLVSSCLSVRSSVCPHGTTRLRLDGLS